MKLWEYIEKERGQILEELHLDPLEPRTWHCKRLMILDEGDQVVFDGKASVDVTPHPGNTADLVAHGLKNGTRPHLLNAVVRCPPAASQFAPTGYCGTGLYCKGVDEQGREFIWLVDEAAQFHKFFDLNPP